MILSDRTIRAELAAGGLVIDPPPADHAIQPASIDLHLGDQLRHGNDLDQVETLDDNYVMTMWSGDFWLAHTAETVTIPTHLVAQLNGKSSLGRRGLAIHVTAGFIDPGFTGQITLELHNCSRRHITLRPGMPIGQLVLMRLTAPAERPYGSAGLSSKYQGQTGATPSRIGGGS